MRSLFFDSLSPLESFFLHVLPAKSRFFFSCVFFVLTFNFASLFQVRRFFFFPYLLLTHHPRSKWFLDFVYSAGAYPFVFPCLSFFLRFFFVPHLALPRFALFSLGPLTEARLPSFPLSKDSLPLIRRSGVAPFTTSSRPRAASSDALGFAPFLDFPV